MVISLGTFFSSSPTFTAPDGETTTSEKFFQGTSSTGNETIKFNGALVCQMTFTQKVLHATLRVIGNDWLIINE